MAIYGAVNEDAPPDGGYGWVIVGSVFTITFLSLGIMYSVGVIFDILIDEFGCTKSQVSIIASIAFSFQCFLGPVVSAMQQKFQTRVVVFIGCVFISIALISSTFAPNLIWLYFSFGVVGGTGMALVYLPVIVVISFYFTRRRSLATALGGIGAYVGCFVHPYLIRLLISFYNWRGALFVLGALELNALAASLLLRPIVTISKTKSQTSQSLDDALVAGKILTNNRLHSVKEEVDEDGALDRTIHFTISNSSKILFPEAVEMALAAGEFARQESIISTDGGIVMTPPSLQQQQSVLIERLQSTTSNKRRFSEVNDIIQHLRQISASSDTSYKDALRRISAPSLENKRNSSSLLAIGEEQQDICYIPHFDILDTFGIRASRQPSRRHTVVKGLAAADLSQLMPSINSSSNIYCPGLLNIPVSTSITPALTAAGELSRVVINEEAETTGTMQVVGEEDDEQVVKLTTCNQIKLLAQAYLRHFRNFRVVLFCVTNFLKGLVYYSPSLFIVGWGTQLGLTTDQATLLISLVGIGNIIGRPAMAFCGDTFAKYRVQLLAAMLALNGAMTITLTNFANFFTLAFFVFQYAFLIGGAQTLFTPILADLVPLSELGFAFGVVIAAKGAAVLIGPPLLGLLPSYGAVFSATGLILLFISTMLTCALYGSKLLLSCRKKISENRKAMTA